MAAIDISNFTLWGEEHLTHARTPNRLVDFLANLHAPAVRAFTAALPYTDNGYSGCIPSALCHIAKDELNFMVVDSTKSDISIAGCAVTEDDFGEGLYARYKQLRADPQWEYLPAMIETARDMERDMAASAAQKLATSGLKFRTDYRLTEPLRNIIVYHFHLVDIRQKVAQRIWPLKVPEIV